MKNYLILLIAVQVLMATNAEAKFYSCEFTEPFFDLLISTESKIITYAPAEMDGVYNKHIKVESIKELKDHILINDNILINYEKTGSNGMSDDVYPYSVEYTDENGTKHFGGCASEEKHYSTILSRISSTDKFGLTMVNYWAGEYGHVTGFKTKNTVLLAAGETYSDIENYPPIKDEKVCKIKKGKTFIPSLASKGEIYAGLFKTQKYLAIENYDDSNEDDTNIKKGDIYYELAYASEGYCVVENNGKANILFCPSNSTTLTGTPIFQLVDEQNQPIAVDPTVEFSSEYVYTKCEDQHWTWISKELMSNSNDFESAHDPSLDGQEESSNIKY